MLAVTIKGGKVLNVLSDNETDIGKDTIVIDYDDLHEPIVIPGYGAATIGVFEIQGTAIPIDDIYITAANPVLTITGLALTRSAVLGTTTCYKLKITDELLARVKELQSVVRGKEALSIEIQDTFVEWSTTEGTHSLVPVTDRSLIVYARSFRFSCKPERGEAIDRLSTHSIKMDMLDSCNSGTIDMDSIVLGDDVLP